MTDLPNCILCGSTPFRGSTGVAGFEDTYECLSDGDSDRAKLCSCPMFYIQLSEADWIKVHGKLNSET